MAQHKGIEILHLEDQQAFLDWLELNSSDMSPYWLKIAKKNTGKTSISYLEARDAALMYGWIDGLTNRLDENYYLIRFCHRRPKSVWSKINIKRIEEFTAEGKMRPEGVKEVEAAKADGRWDKAY